jgi:hypothetical protein
MSKSDGEWQQWKSAWKDRKTRRLLYISVPILAGTMALFSRFILTVEARPGVVLPDPLLALFPARDATWIIFTLIYGGLLTGVMFLLAHPRQLVLALQAYTLLVLVRMGVMWLVPLEPPAGIIPLIDPFAAATTGTTLMKDLFFSGHTATFCILVLTAKHRRVQGVFLFCTVATAALLLVQHVHYSVDVAAAPFFAYGCYRIVALISLRSDDVSGGAAVSGGSATSGTDGSTR